MTIVRPTKIDSIGVLKVPSIFKIVRTLVSHSFRLII